MSLAAQLLARILMASSTQASMLPFIAPYTSVLVAPGGSYSLTIDESIFPVVPYLTWSKGFVPAQN
jgi:hypothetical protein